MVEFALPKTQVFGQLTCLETKLGGKRRRFRAWSDYGGWIGASWLRVLAP